MHFDVHFKSSLRSFVRCLVTTTELKSPRAFGLMQRSRRGYLARLRNYLLAVALQSEDHVLWVDADIRSVPGTMLPDMLTSGTRLAGHACPAPRTHASRAAAAGVRWEGISRWQPVVWVGHRDQQLQLAG